MFDMRHTLVLATLAGFVAIGASARANEPIKATLGTGSPPARAVWIGSVEFVSQTKENHVENGDLKPGSAGAATAQPGTYSNAMRRLETEQAQISVSDCESRPGCSTAVSGAFSASERFDAKQESRWARDCPAGASGGRAMRTDLVVKQGFRQKRGPATAELGVRWDASRNIWVVEARLLPGAAALRVCDDLTSVVENVDPGCGESAPPTKTAHPAQGSDACFSPAAGGTFEIAAPADATELKGSKTLENSVTADPPPSGAVRQKDGSVGVERRIVYDLKRVDAIRPDGRAPSPSSGARPYARSARPAAASSSASGASRTE
jgi:hypothetical protein